ncbi:MAG: metallophosphoesterase [Myxococcota bacterium]
MKLAAIGDVHLAFNDADLATFNASDYAAVLITGDLPGMRHGQAYDVAARLAGLTRPAFMVPGNHDATTVPQLLSDIAGVKGGPLNRPGPHRERIARLDDALGPVTLGGYSAHELGGGVSLVIGRPHAQGGGLSFPATLADRFDVHSMAESAERLIEAVDATQGERLVFLAHNGPSGLGATATDIWGCDFKRGAGDWGDPDLAVAIAHAREIGRQVLAVVAGHMHHKTRGGAQRIWHVEREGIAYINAAQVPRILRREGQRLHHHVALDLTGDTCQVEAIWVPEAGDPDKG